MDNLDASTRITDLAGLQAEDKKTPPQPPAEPQPTDVVAQSDAALTELATFFRSLPRDDRLATSLAAGFFLLMAMPWASTERDGATIGFFTSAWASGLFAAGVLVLIYYRRVSHAAGKQAAILRFTQLFCACAAASGCLLFVRTTSAVTFLRVGHQGYLAPHASTEWGAYAATLNALLLVAASATAIVKARRAA